MVDKLFLKSDLASKSKQNTELQKQLRTVADLISTTVLTFSVVKANVVWINTEEGEEDAGNMGMVSLCYGLIFLVDFISKWFKQYSIYLAGERAEVVSNEAETRMLNLAEMRIVDLVIYSQVNLWLAINYMQKFPSTFKDFFPILSMAQSLGLTGRGFKVYINIVELKQGFHRIIDYDVEIKNREARESAGKKTD